MAGDTSRKTQCGGLWRLEMDCRRAEAEAAVLAASLPEGLLALAAGEGPDGRWWLVGWTEGAPDAALCARFRALLPEARGGPATAPEAEADWVAVSQAGLPPVDAGRFHLHAAAHRGRARPGQWPLRIEAGPAFGTGHHETTRGCLIALQRLARRTRPRRVCDVGTGTAVLAIAALRLWPGADVRAGDVDRRAVRFARETAKRNGLASHRLRPVPAAGLLHPQLLKGAPYDLVTANILAGPLCRLAPMLSAAVAPAGHLLLAGFLPGQQAAVEAAYRTRGFRRAAAGGGAWPVLLLRKRAARPPGRRPGPGRLLRAAKRGTTGRRREPDEA